MVATDAKRRWIDHVAVGPNGAVAWSAGKQAFARTGKGAERMLEVPSTVGGLAFAPKGFRLAIAHYNGVTLWFPNAQTAPETLEWKGSHLGAPLSPDGQFLVTAMQEPTLHGWRLVDRKDMRMSGYAARVRSLDWTAGGKWLATSGSNQLILWPFQAKDGPMGKKPRILAPAEAQVEVVACHPKQEVVAVGYADGLVLLVRIDDGAEVLARKARRRAGHGARLERDRQRCCLRHRGRRRPASSISRDAQRALTRRYARSNCLRAGRSGSPLLLLLRAALGCGPRAAGCGPSALSGSRFQTWLRPNSEMPR